MTHRRHETAVRRYPISIDWPLDSPSMAKPIADCRRDVRDRNGIAPEVKLGIGVDRLDYTKGIIERMQAVFDRVNHASFGGRLPRVPIHLSRKMKRRNGHFSSTPLEIVISWRLCVHGAPGEAEETMRHEMIHLWQYIEGLPVDHGPAFRRAARRLDVHPRATRPVKWQRGAPRH